VRWHERARPCAIWGLILDRMEPVRMTAAAVAWSRGVSAAELTQHKVDLAERAVRQLPYRSPELVIGRSEPKIGWF
jgi:hypothetical protein